MKAKRALQFICIVLGTLMVIGCNVGTAAGGDRPPDWKPGPQKPPSVSGKTTPGKAAPGQVGAQ